MRSKRFLQAVRNHIVRYDLIPRQTHLLVACSGGQDSLALAHALHTMLSIGWLPEVTLHIAHIDHGLREKDSAADARRVLQFAASLSLPATVRAITEDERAQWTGSLEASARDARYRLLRQIAAEQGATRIAVGHTIDDQAETVLMHLLRGSGINGLSGMRPLTHTIIRPLLVVRRADTAAYCQEHHLDVASDATNEDRRFTRNRLRHDIIPVLETIQPHIQPILARNATMLAHDADFLTMFTEQTWQHILLEAHDDQLILDRTKLRESPPAIRWRIVRHAVSIIGDDHPDHQVSFDTLTRFDAVLLDHSGDHRIVQLAANVDAVFTRDAVQMAQRSR